MTRTPQKKAESHIAPTTDYGEVVADVVGLLESAQKTVVRSTNAVMTATYWMIGHRIVEQEQKGKTRATYGAGLLEELAKTLSVRFGRGFSVDRLETMRLFYLKYSSLGNSATVSRKLKEPSALISKFNLSWSHYVLLIRRSPSDEAREFYENEASRGGWTVRQLERQIDSQFYQRTLLSKAKSSMLKKGSNKTSADSLTPEEELKDPFVLEFLGLKDEYSENELEESLIKHLETFLLELGPDFAFIGRQRRLRIASEWYRVDLLFFHRRLRCLLVIDLKIGRFTHADAGQMHLYLNYAKEHWMLPGENPPVGLILCAFKEDAVVRYALEGLSNKVLAATYRTTLPTEEALAAELMKSTKLLSNRHPEKKAKSKAKPKKR